MSEITSSQSQDKEPVASVSQNSKKNVSCTVKRRKTRALLLVDALCTLFLPFIRLERRKTRRQPLLNLSFFFFKSWKALLSTQSSEVGYDLLFFYDFHCTNTA